MTSVASVVRFEAARRDPSLVVLEGFHAVKHAIRFGATITDAVTTDAAALDQLARELAPDVAGPLGSMVATIASAEFRHLTTQAVDTGVVAIAERPRYDDSLLDRLPADRPVVLLEAPAHGGNVGAVVRVAAAIDAAAVLTTGVHDPWNAGALRGSAGLHFALPVLRITLDRLPARPLIAVDPDGSEPLTAGLPEGAILAFGSERRGLSAELLGRADRRVRIPMRRGVSSLNLATAVAVALYCSATR